MGEGKLHGRGEERRGEKGREREREGERRRERGREGEGEIERGLDMADWGRRICTEIRSSVWAG